MSKKRIYIDFEEISDPFNRDLKLNKLMPYAYTIGAASYSGFKTKTFVVDFKKVDTGQIYEHLRTQITTDIRTLLQKDDLEINEATIEFAGFGCALEKMVIKMLFKNIKVIEINKGKDISLTRVTRREMGHKDYFQTFRALAKKSLEPGFFKERGLEKDGSLAALAGYTLYLNARRNHYNNYKYEVKIDFKQLLQEIIEYSKDDVLRMKIIVDDYPLFYRKVKKYEKLLAEVDKQTRVLNLHKTIMKKIKDVNPDMRVSDYIEQLSQKISKMEDTIIATKESNGNSLL